MAAEVFQGDQDQLYDLFLAQIAVVSRGKKNNNQGNKIRYCSHAH